jgi:hypothetical protein
MVVGLPQPSLFSFNEKGKSTFFVDYYDIYYYNKRESKIICKNSHINFQQYWTISNLTTNLNLCKRNGYYYTNNIDDTEDNVYLRQSDIFLSSDFLYSLSPKTKLRFYLEMKDKMGGIVGLEKKFGHHQFLFLGGIRFNCFKLEYDIHNLSSFFPFGYAIIDKEFGYRNRCCTSVLTHQNIVSDKDNNDKYPGDIFGQNISWLNEWKHQNHILNFFISKLNLSGSFEYKNKEFFKLDNLSLFFTRLEIKKYSESIDFTLGSEYYRFNVGDDSYFDIWPFSVWTAIYDFDRIRLKEFNVELIQPFIQVEKEFGWQKSKHKLTFNYSHLFFDNNYFYKKRKIIIVYPQYIPYIGTLDLDIDAIVELMYDLFLPINNQFNIKFMLSQKIPIDYDTIRHISGDELKPDKNTHGGTKISLTLDYFF